MCGRTTRGSFIRIGVGLTLVSLFGGGAAHATTDIEAKLQAALTRLDTQEKELAAQRQMLLEMREQLERHVMPAAVSSAAVAAPMRATVASDGSTETASAQATVGSDEANARRDDPTMAALNDFAGAFRVPGEKAALRLGGYVKADLIHNVDPLQALDRFIVGSIPTSDDADADVKTQSQITASQSRLNLDYRQATEAGIMRAFAEGDFQGSDETFRLRHAFGQWRYLLAGQTWSAFMDTASAPEEIDFEGLNGRINVRQAQIRLSPQITELGRRFQVSLSIENPDPQVTGGTGLSQVPDLVVSGSINRANGTHVQVAAIARSIRADWDTTPGITDDSFGWGVSVSGTIGIPHWNPKDLVLFQVSGGRGIGRYVNDLDTVGDFDGVFSPTGNLKLLDVYAGYVSGQHWWRESLRSNLTFGFVQVDSPDFVPPDFYERTYRASVNLIWTPTPGLDMGGELLWGEREDVDGSDGNAQQIQLAAKYQF